MKKKIFEASKVLKETYNSLFSTSYLIENDGTVNRDITKHSE